MSLKEEIERQETANNLYNMRKNGLDAIQNLSQIKTQLSNLITTATNSSYYTQADIDEINSVISELTTELQNKVLK